MPRISALPAGVATSSTPFAANVGSTTAQVTLAPVYTSLASLQTQITSQITALIAFSALPAAGTAGKTYLFSDSPYVARDNGTSYDYFFLGTQVYPWDDTGFTWDNQGASTLTTSGGVKFFSIPAATTNIRVRYESAPATPWTLTILQRVTFFAADNTQYAGIVLRDATGKLYIFYTTGANAMQAIKFTNATTFSAVGMTNGSHVAHGDWQWVQVSDDGVNIIFRVSVDGINFVQVGSEARTAFLLAGPTQLGVFVNTDNGVNVMASTVYSYRKT